MSDYMERDKKEIKHNRFSACASHRIESLAKKEIFGCTN
jgi:hypothetical protein